MELRQLEYFVAVAEQRNFTRAAEQVHISQSGVSAQIRQLERELGAELFDRSARVATLTSAGKAALGHARDVLAAAAAVRESVSEVCGLIRGQVRIGMVNGCTMAPLFDALAAFRQAHPGVDVSLLEDNSARLAEAVRSGALDLALLGTAALPAGLEALTIVSERLVAVVPPDHPLACRGQVGLADLVGLPVICMPAGTGLRAVLDQACAARQHRLSIAMEASAADAIAGLAARGLGAGILSESMAIRYRGRLAAPPIGDITAPGLLALVWRPGPGPAVRALAAAVGRAFGADTGPVRQPDTADPAPTTPGSVRR
ncbi:MAG: LysR substrate-binding domain-containing protein [Actinomycetota bacterium]|nr:LysR substrate-binding domain-containing protein [Actinomycetota bacterium]